MQVLEKSHPERSAQISPYFYSALSFGTHIKCNRFTLNNDGWNISFKFKSHLKDTTHCDSTNVLSLLSHVFLNSLSPNIFAQLFSEIQDRFLAVERLNNQSTIANLILFRRSDSTNVINGDTGTSASSKKLSVDGDYVELCLQSFCFVGIN